MSSGIKVMENRFVLLNNSNSSPCYSIVRTHFVKDVLIKKNTFILEGNASNSVVKMGNSQNVVVEKNTIASIATAGTPPIVVDATYTLGCKLKKNKIKYVTIGSLLTLEYNDNLQIKKNTIEVGQMSGDIFKLFSRLSNHYSYPPQIYTESRIESNRFVFKNWNGDSFDISNKYDFPVLFRLNKLKRNGVSTKIKKYNNEYN